MTFHNSFDRQPELLSLNLIERFFLFKLNGVIHIVAIHKEGDEFFCSCSPLEDASTLSQICEEKLIQILVFNLNDADVTPFHNLTNNNLIGFIKANQFRIETLWNICVAFGNSDLERITANIAKHPEVV